MRTVSLALLGLLMAAPLAAAQQLDDYDTCIALVENDPEAAARLAGDWARFGGGPGARHCYALALVAIGARSQAVDQLLDLAAEETELSAEARADVLVQAGELLIDLDESAAAGLAAAEALRLVPNARNALALRAAVRIANQNYSAGIDDLNRALAVGQPVARFLIRRAAARRLSGSLVAARDDAVFATEVDPELPAGWLERGRIEAKIGDTPTARNSLLRAISLDREGPIGRRAQIVLQRMEAGVE